MTEPLRHKSFTKDKNREPVSFELDGDTFYCAPKLPTPLLRRLSTFKSASAQEGMTQDRIESIFGILRDVLLDASVELYNQRLESKERPIDINDVNDIISWLLEVYGLRPFQESSPSLDGSMIQSIESGGTSSTDGVQVLELIQTNSPQTDS